MPWEGGVTAQGQWNVFFDRFTPQGAIPSLDSFFSPSFSSSPLALSSVAMSCTAFTVVDVPPPTCGVSDVTKFRIRGSKLRSWHQTRCIPGRWVPFWPRGPPLRKAADKPFFFFVSAVHCVLCARNHIPRQTSSSGIPYRSPNKVSPIKKEGFLRCAKRSIIHNWWGQSNEFIEGGKYENPHDRLPPPQARPEWKRDEHMAE